jgi:dehydrogenase/reductase SDR family protein 12
MFSRLLDASIVRSFDRSGFLRHEREFHPADLEVDLHGRVCLVTGANSGIGFETSLALAERGASVWLLCRNRERGDAAAREIRGRTGSRRVRSVALDVSDLADVERFVAQFGARKVDVLVHNAGVLPPQRIESAQGHEITLATHVLGPSLLTRLLVPKLSRSEDPRVVFVSSGGMYPKKLTLDDVEWRSRSYDGVAAYAQTKRMQVVLAELLAKRLTAQGIKVNSMHPGWADTPAVQSSLPRFWRLMKNRLRTPAQGADTVIWLACSPAASRETGGFWFDRARRSPYLVPGTREGPSARAALLNLCGWRGAGPGLSGATGGNDERRRDRLVANRREWTVQA